ncbi:MAG: hypothetical protein DI535_14270 [Citrobacter freundii]|nr:MAG: hypothetical protein DI535_14270 [Citrobacter freundii]
MRLSNLHPGCHGIPERCFKIKGKAMPFCARCLGASAGHVTGLTAGIFLPAVPFYCLFAALLIMLADWNMQNKLHRYHSNISRLITGVGGGFAVGELIVIFLKALL